MARGYFGDDEWALTGVLLPAEPDRWARPAMDNRRFLGGMLYLLRVGCQWRDMHERYGKWNSYGCSPAVGTQHEPLDGASLFTISRWRDGSPRYVSTFTSVIQSVVTLAG